MKKGFLFRFLASILLGGMLGLSSQGEDARIIVKLGHNPPGEELRTASLYLVFKGDKSDSLTGVETEDESRFYAEVWDDLYLQVTPDPGEEGTEGYIFAFTKDKAGKDPVALKESKDALFMKGIAAMDFRTADNSSARPLKPGPGTLEDRGALRLIHYDGFDAEIRVLEFNIGGATVKKKPFFKSLSCLVTITEKAPAAREK